ncbi:MAG: NUDIX domain-containing protein [Armatimonadota bacterium]
MSITFESGFTIFEYGIVKVFYHAMPKVQTTRIGCYAVIVEDYKILLCRLSEGLTHQGRWTLPGGGLEFGEALEAGLQREVREETGLDVTTKALLAHHSGLWQLPEKEIHSFQFLFSVEIIGGNLTHEQNGSTDRAEWVEFDSITAENSVDIVHQALGLAKQPSFPG